MNPRQYFLDYVERNGGLQAVSDNLGIPYPSLASVSNGSRGIGKAMAKRMVAADPSLDISVLVLVEQTKRDKSARKVPIRSAITNLGAGRYMAFGTLEQIAKLIRKETERGGG